MKANEESSTEWRKWRNHMDRIVNHRDYTSSVNGKQNNEKETKMKVDYCYSVNIKLEGKEQGCLLRRPCEKSYSGFKWKTPSGGWSTLEKAGVWPYIPERCLNYRKGDKVIVNSYTT